MAMWKKVVLALAGVLVVGLLGAGGWAYAQVSAFDESASRVHDIPLPQVELSTDAEVLARGEHLVRSVGGCASTECHGPQFSGGKLMEMGPVGAIAGPNITPGGMLAVYSDGELARLLTTGVKKDGRTVLMMTVQDFSWLPKSDVDAIISYLRTVPASDKPNGTTFVKPLGKILDRQGAFPWDIARFVEQLPKETAPAPEPTAKYGRFMIRLCTGCHGETLSGGPLPGAPPDLPVPSNITKHPTGIGSYSYEDFVKVLQQGVRKNGQKLDPFMAVDLTKNLDDIELRALWAEIQSRPPKEFGGR
jgi:mono/diheme cytochrome c family protein